MRTARDSSEAAGVVRVVGGRAVPWKQIEMSEADGVDRSIRSIRGG
jgi:hypothetical protein